MDVIRNDLCYFWANAEKSHCATSSPLPLPGQLRKEYAEMEGELDP